MTVDQFLAKWRTAGGAERANKDLFLSDLCDVLGVERPRPTTKDEAQDSYVFEKNVTRSREDGTSIGKIDLYRAGCFVLEAKQIDPGKRSSPAWEQAMNAAHGQALGYARSLPEPPPFVLVCDLGHCLDVYASFDGSGAYRPFPDGFRKRLFFADLERHAPFLRNLWLDPLALDPSRHQARVTREVAGKVAGLARELEAAGHDPRAVAEFLMRCLFTMFAEDVGLIPGKLFSKYLEEYWLPNPATFPGGVSVLWRDMDEGRDTVAGRLLRFNGGVFADRRALPLSAKQLQLLAEAAASDWAAVDPSIFGTLLERALDPAERHRLGAHYTPRAYVERLVKPTIEEPLRADWDLVRAEVRQLVDAGKVVEAQGRVRDFHQRLCKIHVLDPACGTGNFLYVTLDLFKRLETEVLAELSGLGYQQMGLELESFRVTPEQFRGLEVKPWAKEIAELVLWIGYLQWQVRQTGEAGTVPEPVLRDYGNIECRDAVLAWDGDPELARDEHGVPVTRWDGVTTKPSPVTGEPIPDDTARIPVYTYTNPRASDWPKADFIVGNPPYIGNKRMRTVLGDGYVEALRAAHTDVPETADYVMYWWDRAASLVAAGKTRRFGLITTNSITQVFNRRVVEGRLGEGGISIVFAIPDHPWVDSVDGAAVRVAMTVGEGGRRDGKAVWVEEEVAGSDGAFSLRFGSRHGRLNSDLTVGANVTGVARLKANEGVCFQGFVLVGGGFVIDAAEARSLLSCDAAIMSRVRRWKNGRDLLGDDRGMFVIDLFGLDERQGRDLHPGAYQHLLQKVKPARDQVARKNHREKWWIWGEARPGLRKAVKGLARQVVTNFAAKHRVFVFEDPATAIDHNMYVIAVDNPELLAILSSTVHTRWMLAAGSSLEDRPIWINSTCFLPFPFPIPSTQTSLLLRDLGEQLDAHRKARQAEHPGLTITGMYNVLEKLRSGEALTAKEKVIHDQGLVSVLKQIHDEIDAAVFEAYGWPATLGDEEILERLVALNHERAEEEKRGLVRWLRPEFQNPGGTGVALQDDLPGTAVAARKTTKHAGDEGGASAEKRAWPGNLPGRIAAVRDLLAERGALDLAAAKAAFKGAKDAALDAALDSLAAVGLAVVTQGDAGKRWSVLR